MLAQNLKQVKPPKTLLKSVGKAIYDFEMVKSDDRVLLAVSGGKDSLGLFHILRHLQKHAPIRFMLGVVSIDPKSDIFDLKPLKKYFLDYQVPYFPESFAILEQAKKSMQGNSYCAFCARMKRGLMYKVAKRQHYNVLALGQHLDDLAESLLMSIFHNGCISTMKAHYLSKYTLNDNRAIRVIRPMIYVRERQLRDFAQKENLPVIRENCPACFKKPTERAYFKAWLNKEEGRIANLYPNIKSAIKPILEKSSYWQSKSLKCFIKKTND